ncbi:ADP-ribosylation factor 1 [Linum perenne]
MGILFTRMFSSVFGNKEARILVLGLDNAGKTTILCNLLLSLQFDSPSSIGFNVETVQYNNIKFQVWDLELRGAIVLIFANKQDLPGALDAAAVTEALELHKIKNRQWAIFKTCAVKGEGLYEGLDWLSNTLKSGGS